MPTKNASASQPGGPAARTGAQGDAFDAGVVVSGHRLGLHVPLEVGAYELPK